MGTSRASSEQPEPVLERKGLGARISGAAFYWIRIALEVARTTSFVGMQCSASGNSPVADPKNNIPISFAMKRVFA